MHEFISGVVEIVRPGSRAKLEYTWNVWVQAAAAPRVGVGAAFEVDVFESEGMGQGRCAQARRTGCIAIRS